MLEDKAGHIWIGTWGGGLNCLRLGRDSTEDHWTAYAATNGLGSDFVLGLGEDRAGNLWIGTSFDTRPLKRLQDGQITAYGKEEGFLDVSVEVIYEDRQENLWIGARAALNRFKNGQFTRFTKEDGLADQMVSWLHRPGCRWRRRGGGAVRHLEKSTAKIAEV